ncbi:hypothetical protein F5I97DRAFT_1934499 [Phlebopus sp. FC_14]|nr:hypothetical protein F5I97DRAFT_1934499 [Phlebopus sp. FC_14]
MTTVYYGPVINPQTLTSYLALQRCLIVVGPDGNIAWIDEGVDRAALPETMSKHGFASSDYALVDLQPGEFILPGFIDTHIHACQVPNLGLGGEYELLDWLKNCTFPTEANFSDLHYAARTYPDVVRRTITSGTTTCCYYGTIHLEATKLLASTVREKGQRAFVGKCNMNWHCPPYYVEPSVDDSVAATVALIEHIRGLPLTAAGEPLVHPVITPRFAISCTEELLARLGDLAKTLPDVAIQTHISENMKEVQDTLELFKEESYAAIYDKFSLLRQNTILAHGVHLTDAEMKLVAEKRVGISHCPTSNFHLNSGMARVGTLLDHGVKVGLGTDVSGGYHPSILYSIQMASNASKMLSLQAGSDGHCHMYCRRGEDRKQHELQRPSTTQAEPGKEGRFTNKRLRAATLLYLATMGGAEVCCLQDRIGSFEKGKAFDALVVSVRDETGNPAIWGYNPTRDLGEGQDAQDVDLPLNQWLERFLFCGDDRNIRRVIVQGTVIGGQEFRA